MDLWGRRWSLSIGSLDLTECDLAFKITRHIHRSPNTAEIKVWNLSPETRAQIEGAARPYSRPGVPGEEEPDGIVRLALGYGADDPPQVFRGDLRLATTEWPTNTDSVLVCVARDGGNAYSGSRVSLSYPAGTSVVTALRDVVRAMEIGEGNLSEFSAVAFRTGSSTFPDGWAAHGRAHVVLNDLCRAAGLRWSVQSGALQLQRQGAPLESRSVLLTSDSGLTGSPSWDERGKRTRGRRGRAQVQCLIMPGLDPGRKARVESDTVTGDFEIRQVSLSGDTRANDWFADLELRPLG